MAQDLPIFGAPAPNPLYARSQGTNIQEFPSGYLEAFKAAADMRQRAAEFAATQAVAERKNQLDYEEKMTAHSVEQQKTNILASTEARKSKLEELKFRNDWTETQQKNLSAATTAINQRMQYLRARSQEENVGDDEKFSINSELGSLAVQSSNIVKSLAKLSGVEEVPQEASPSLNRYYSNPSLNPPTAKKTAPASSFSGLTNNKVPVVPVSENVQPAPVVPTQAPVVPQNGDIVPLSVKNGVDRTIANVASFAEAPGAPVSYTGPLNKRFQDWIPIVGIGGNEVRQTIYPNVVKNADGGTATEGWKIAFPVKNIGENQAQIDLFDKQKRALSQMTFLIENKLLDGVDVTTKDIQNASLNFGVKGLNEDHMTSIAKAFKLHSMLVGSHPNGEYSPAEVAANAVFENKFGQTAAEHYMLGDEGKTAYTTSSAENQKIINDAKEAQRRRSELSAEQPEVVDKGFLDALDSQKKIIEEETKKLNGYDKELNYPGANVKELTQKRLLSSDRISAANVSIAGIGTRINLAKSKNEARTNQIQALSKIAEAPLEIYKTEAAKGENVARAVSAADRLPGWNMSSVINNGGWKAKALTQLEHRSYNEQVYDKFGRLITVELPLSGFLQRAIDNGDYSGIQALLFEAPDEKSIAYHKETNEKLDASIVPINKLFEGAVKMDSYSFIGQGWEKVFDTEANTLEPWRKALIAGMRTDIVGPGNPSNFEQEMMQDIIPNVQSLFSVSGRNVRRIQEVALLKVVSHFNAQTRAGYEPTQLAVDRYNAAFGKIIGRNLTLAELKGLVYQINSLESTRIQDINNANYESSRKDVFGQMRESLQNFISPSSDKKKEAT